MAPDSASQVPRANAVSKLTALLDDESDTSGDFFLAAPDKYGVTTRHLYTQVKFSIGGKVPDSFITCELSTQHIAKEVIKHVLTLLRRNRELQA